MKKLGLLSAAVILVVFIGAGAVSAQMSVFRPSTGLWYMDLNNNGQWDGCNVDGCLNFGMNGDLPVSGDWDFSGASKLGVFRPSTGKWYLDLNGNGQWDGCSIDGCCTFGMNGDLPVSGDWDASGITKIGVFRPSTGKWYLDLNGNGQWDGCSIDGCYTFGMNGDLPVSGDWDASGITKIGVFRPSTGKWYLDLNGNGQWDGCSIDGCFTFGTDGDTPVVGDWNHDGAAEIGVFRANTGMQYLDVSGNGGWDGCSVDGCYHFGMSGDLSLGFGGSDTRLLSSEFLVEDNWQAYETKDQIAPNQPDAAPLASKYFAPAAQNIGRDDRVLVYTANGLVSEFFNYLVVSQTKVAVGSIEYGVSYLALSDIYDPRGKVYNYRQFGLWGMAAYQDEIYAWSYDGQIVKVSSGEVVYAEAPNGTGSIWSAIPKNRFKFDSEGNIWLGTSNLDENGAQVEGSDNGLYKIDTNFSAKTKILNHPVWDLHMDSAGDLWASTYDGIYKQDELGAFQKVYNGWAEQILEFNGQTYAIIKDFFHRPASRNDFDLYRWDGETFSYVCELSAVFGDLQISEMYAFVWNNTLYVAMNGNSIALAVYDGVSSFSLQWTPIYNSHVGQSVVVPGDGKLFSVGNLTGIVVWDGSEVLELNTTNTAEALICNDINTLYPGSDGNLFIAPKASGFNIFDKDSNFQIHEVPEEYFITGIFEHGDTFFVQGASSLYTFDGTNLQNYKTFACNGERVYYDSVHGKLWAFPNFGNGPGSNGALAMLDVGSKIIYGTTGYDNRLDYWQRDFEWTKPAYHFNDVTYIPNENAAFIALENGNGIVLKYDYGTNTFSEVEIPCDLIRKFAVEGDDLYAVGYQELLKYENGVWEKILDTENVNPTALGIKGNWAFVGFSGQLEIVQTQAKKSSTYTFSQIPIRGVISDIKIANNTSLSGSGASSKAYKLWLGTNFGLVFCKMNLR